MKYNLILLLTTVILVSGCGSTLPHKHMNKRDTANSSMIYGVIDLSKNDMELESVLLQKKALSPDGDDIEIHLRVAGDVFYLENLEQGEYEIISFRAKTKAWSSDGTIRKSQQFAIKGKNEKLKFSIIQPGVYFITDLVLINTRQEYTNFFLQERKDIYEKRRALTTALFYSTDEEWVSLAKTSPVDHVPSMELEFAPMPVAETGPR